MLWNMVDAREKTDLYEKAGRVMDGLGLSVVGFKLYGDLANMDKDTMAKVTNLSGNLILFSVILTFIVAGFIKKINVYDAFIEGAKEGFTTAVRIIPYLVAILVGVGVFRASGAMDMLIHGISWCMQQCGQHRFRGCTPYRLHETIIRKRSARIDA